MLTGASGVVGGEVAEQLRQCGAPPVEVVRRLRRSDQVAWQIGRTPRPAELAGRWDVVVHCAATTRWNLSRAEAVAANIAPTQALVDGLDPSVHLIHISTAYADGADPDQHAAPSGFGRYRNGYEWSKARCEQVVRSHPGPLTVIRPPLVIGRAGDGRIGRFSGPYTLMQSLVSGLAAVVVGDPDGYAELAPVDLVARTVVEAVLADPPAEERRQVITGGAHCLRLAEVLQVMCDELNRWRADRGIDPVVPPPFIPSRRWHRFFLPLARQHLSPVQLQVVALLGAFEGYTSLPQPLAPTRQVVDPAAALARSVRYWADQRPRLAGRAAEPWQGLAGLGGRTTGRVAPGPVTPGTSGPGPGPGPGPLELRSQLDVPARRR